VNAVQRDSEQLKKRIAGRNGSTEKQELQRPMQQAKLKSPFLRPIRPSRHSLAPTMSNSRTAGAVFEQELLPIRAKLLEIAAALDRIDRSVGTISSDRRRTQVQAAIQVLLRPEDDRAEQIQLIFSRPYNEDWQEQFRMTNDE
jgi:hypothetical protein